MHRKHTEKENDKLFQLAQNGDEESLLALYSKHLGLVYSILRRYPSSNHDEDVEQVAKTALLTSILHFDFTMNVQFSTYAYPTISGEIKRYYRTNRLVKLNEKIRQDALAINRFVAQFETANMRQPTLAEIQEATQLEGKEIAVAWDSNRPCLSIDAPVDVGQGRNVLLPEVLTDEETPLEEKYILLDTLNEALRGLSDKEKAVIYARYFEEEKQKQIAEQMGVSQVQVSRIEKKALLKLKKTLQET